MARALTWSDVRGGLIACAVIALAAFGILRFMRVGALKGDTFPMYAVVSEARGVMKGSEVWLTGQKIGKITDIRFLPVTSDTTRRILLTMDVLDEHRHALRKDAVAQIRAGGSVVGAPVLYLSGGTMHAPMVEAGDTVRTLVQADVEGATVQFNQAAKDIPAVIANVKVLNAQLKTTEGTMGALMHGAGMSQLKTARDRATSLMSRFSAPSGSIGPIMNAGVSARAGRVMARVDSVRTLLASRNTSLGRFRRDSSLMGEVDDIRNELTLVRASLDESRGTLGRALHDSALTTSLGQAQREMSLLIADIKKHPGRYLSVSF